MNNDLTIVLTIAMAISVIEDVRRFKIPNWITFSTMIIAMISHSISGGFEGLFFSFCGMAAGIGIFIVPYFMGVMGAGDAKLMGAAGAILGPKGILVASVFVLLTGGIYGIILFFLNPQAAVSFAKRLWATFKTFCLTSQFIIIPPAKEENQPVLRYAIPIAVGTLSYKAIELTGYDLFAQILGI